jgi:hypothetical protein
MRKTEPLLGGSIPNARPFGDASSSPRFDAGESSVIQSTVLTSCGTAGGLTAFGAGPSIRMTDLPAYCGRLQCGVLTWPYSASLRSSQKRSTRTVFPTWSMQCGRSIDRFVCLDFTSSSRCAECRANVNPHSSLASLSVSVHLTGTAFCTNWSTFAIRRHAWRNRLAPVALSLPAHGRCHNATGQPIGTHLVAGFGREDLLIQVSSQLEQARPWKERRPPICA